MSRLFRLCFLLSLALISSQARAQGVLEIMIVRTSENAASTTGELYVGGRFVAHTLELPWKENRSYISSIPVGTYSSHLRYDKADGWRIQIDGVPGRSGVQLHVGNYPSQIEGCVLVGLEVFNADDRLGRSAEAYAALRRAFYGAEDPLLTPNKAIRVTVRYQPRATTLRSAAGALWLYDSSGRWFYGPDRVLQTEYRRDPNYIFIRYHGPNFFMRFPLHGGGAMDSSSRRDGPWLGGESVITREN
jgi:hypothetical protein